MTRRWRWSIAVATFAVGTLLAWWWTQPVSEVVSGVVARSGDHALVLYGSDVASGAVSIALVDQSGALEWEQELPGAGDPDAARHGIAVNEERAAVQLARGGVAVLRLDDGSVAWTSDAPESGSALLGVPPRIAGDTVVDAWTTPGDGRGYVVTGRSLADGSVRWRFRGDSGMPKYSLVAGGWLAIRDMGWTIVPFDEGRAERRGQRLDDRFRGDVCILDGRVVGMDGEHLLTTPLDEPDGPPKAIRLSEPGIDHAMACGTRGRDTVFTGRGADGLVMVAMESTTGQVRWKLSMPGWRLARFGGAPDRHDPRFHPLRGEMLDFVPVLVSGEDASGAKLVVIDVRSGDIAWESALRPGLRTYQVVRSPAGVHYLDGRGHVAALDGDTGKLAGAVRGPTAWLRGVHTTAESLWVYSREVTTGSVLPVLALDARLAPPGHGTDALTVRDDFEETTAWLDVPDAFSGAP
ncbi:MAG: PQQ-binding-like beta-propeller repeat protein [Myxococcota bacterium]